MNKQRTVLLINTHLTYPNFSEGVLNASFHQKAKEFFEANNFEILETKVEDGYDADKEVEKHLQADIIILQTPINWFGAPWIYKKYVDAVFSSAGISKKFLENDGRTREDLSRQYGTGESICRVKNLWFLLLGMHLKQVLMTQGRSCFKEEVQQISLFLLPAITVFVVLI